MTTFTLSLADIPIAVTCLFEETKHFCRDYVTDLTAEIEVIINEEDLQFEQEKSDKQRKLEGLTPYTYEPAYLETLALYRKICDALLSHQVILFHGSSLAVDGKSFLFTAPSGTGKSTHTRLWREHFGERAIMINDDKPLIKLTDHGAVIYGTPWMGKHSLGNPVAFPLKAICHLNRGQENQIELLSFADAYHTILKQTHRPKLASSMTDYLRCIDKLGQAVTFYRLYCTISEDAVLLAHAIMKGNTIMKLHPDYITHMSGDEQVIVATGDSAQKFCGIARGNETTAFIVDTLKEEISREQLIERLLAEYEDAEHDLVASDVDMVIEKLDSIGALVHD